MWRKILEKVDLFLEVAFAPFFVYVHGPLGRLYPPAYPLPPTAYTPPCFRVLMAWDKYGLISACDTGKKPSHSNINASQP